MFGVPLGEQAKLKLAVLAARLRAAGVRVDLAYGDRGVKGAMRAADRSGASIALVAGDRDIEAGTIGVKNLATGEQVDVPVDDVLAEVLSRLSLALAASASDRVCTRHAVKSVRTRSLARSQPSNGLPRLSDRRVTALRTVGVTATSLGELEPICSLRAKRT